MFLLRLSFFLWQPFFFFDQDKKASPNEKKSLFSSRKNFWSCTFLVETKCSAFSLQQLLFDSQERVWDLFVKHFETAGYFCGAWHVARKFFHFFLSFVKKLILLFSLQLSLIKRDWLWQKTKAQDLSFFLVTCFVFL